MFAVTHGDLKINGDGYAVTFLELYVLDIGIHVGYIGSDNRQYPAFVGHLHANTGAEFFTFTFRVPLHIEPFIPAVALVNYVWAGVPVDYDASSGGGKTDNLVSGNGQAAASKVNQCALRALDRQGPRLLDMAAKPALFFRHRGIRNQAFGDDKSCLVAEANLLQQIGPGFHAHGLQYFMHLRGSNIVQ